MKKNNRDAIDLGEAQWLQAVVQELDRAEAELKYDPALCRRLRTLRRQALQPEAVSPRLARQLLPASVMALVVALLVWLPYFANPEPESSMWHAADVDALPIITGSEDPEFYQDLEFLLWLDETQASLG